VFTSLLGSLQLWNLPCQQILQASAPQPRADAPLPSGAHFPLLLLPTSAQIHRACVRTLHVPLCYQSCVWPIGVRCKRTASCN
jgi:hypothetical protein